MVTVGPVPPLAVGRDGAPANLLSLLTHKDASPQAKLRVPPGN